VSDKLKKNIWNDPAPHILRQIVAEWHFKEMMGKCMCQLLMQKVYVLGKYKNKL
jgi:hypothetical protein